MAAVRDRRRAQLEERIAYDGEWQDTGFVFTRKDGTLSDPDVISQRFDEVVAQLGLKPVRFVLWDHAQRSSIKLKSQAAPGPFGSNGVGFEPATFRIMSPSAAYHLTWGSARNAWSEAVFSSRHLVFLAVP